MKPGNLAEPFTIGTIASIGKGTVMNPVDPDLKVDVIVNYWHQQAIDYEIDKEVYHLVRISDIWGIV